MRIAAATDLRAPKAVLAGVVTRSPELILNLGEAISGPDRAACRDEIGIPMDAAAQARPE